ncbi:MAG: hypothetical protein JOY80_00675 [Candidatus Dormibacteraeota bacterium]|nr:hypothetical protein [Candidatus Dormibacteraeota bacterium]
MLGIMAVLAASLSVGALSPVTASAAAPPRGELFGAFSLDATLYRIDPGSGGLTQTATLPPVDYTWDLVARPRSTLLYASSFLCLIPDALRCAESVGELLTIDTSTGKVNAVTLSGFVQNLAYDPIDHSLYGLTVDSCCSGTTTVVRVDMATGTLSPIATIPGITQTLAIDARTQTLYTDVSNDDTITGQLVAIDARTGAVTVRPVVGSALFRLGFGPRARAIFGMTWDLPSRFVRVDPQTGAVTVVGSFGTSLGPQEPVAMAIDPATHTVFVVESDVFGNYTAINRIDTLDERTGAAVLGQTFPGLTTAIAFQERAPA